MRQLFLSVILCALAAGAAWAQNEGENGGGFSIPVGQTFKQFEMPYYEGSVLKMMGYAVEAKGITLNRMEAFDLRIQIYENGAVATTITSPDADLYYNKVINEKRMRTKNTVLIERSDMTASSQDCDFDMLTKKYIMRTNVKVVLKNFDLSMNSSSTAPGSAPTAVPDAAPAAAPDVSATPPTAKPAATPAQNGIASPMAPPLGPISPDQDNGSMLDSPGAVSNNTNSPPSNPESK